jgi:hypothetical protein
MEKTFDLQQVTDKLNTISLCFTIFFNLEKSESTNFRSHEYVFYEQSMKIGIHYFKVLYFFVDMEKWIWN